MPKQDWIENPIDKIFTLYPKGVKSILDVGCGISAKSQYLEAEIRVGVDAYRPYLEKANLDVLINSDCMYIGNLFLPKSFDVVLLIDLVEHLSKEDALKLIAMAEKIAKKAVIIETPLGYIPQNIDIWGMGGDYYQTHRSAWHIHEFEDLRYNVTTRDYEMQNIKRHTEKEVETKIKLIDAIKLL